MYDLGDIVPLTVEVRDSSGSLANAGTITLTITLPDATTVSPTTSSPSTGRYQCDYIPTLTGRYIVRWAATGANMSAYVDRFEVLGPPAETTWPPLLQDLKADLGISLSDTRDDAVLQVELAAAVATVQRELSGDFNFSGTATTLPVPSADVVLGTVRQAGRWHARRRSPDGLVDSGDFGTSRIPRLDSDIERMLGTGAWRRPMV